MYREPIIYKVCGFLGMLQFIWFYIGMKKKYFKIYRTHIARKSIYLFQLSTIIMIIDFFLIMVLDDNCTIPFLLIRIEPLLALWGFVLSIYLYFYCCKKILSDIAIYLLSVSAEDEYRQAYNKIAWQLQGVILGRRVFLVSILLYGIMTYVILTK